MWIKHESVEHRCERPDADTGVHGDIWACNTCGRQWKVVSNGYGRMYWMRAMYKRRLSEQCGSR